MGLFNKKNKNGAYDLRSPAEKKIDKTSHKPLKNSTLEDYAHEVLDIFRNGDGANATGDAFDALLAELRVIGKAVNDNEKMLQIAYRAKFLGEQRSMFFSTRYLEYAWDGIAGWMK